jgi:cytidylate kinase
MLVLRGASGLGKSTVARLLARRLGGRWPIIDFRGLSPAESKERLLTALRVMETMAQTRKPLAELVNDLKVFPQMIQNVRVREKVPFAKVPEIQKAIDDAVASLRAEILALPTGQGLIVK